MLGSFLTRGLVLVFGYAYPAYECYKSVERNKPEIEHLRFWCQYWILVAVLTVCERVGDAFISWVPMYSEAKLAFFIYLWYPKTKGTSYVYDSFFRPYMAKHENEIDRNLLELRTRAGDIAVLYWQRAASYGQTRVFDILQYIAAQSTPRPHPAQPQQPGPRARQTPSTTTHQPSVHAQAENEESEPPSPTSSTTSSHDQKEMPDVAGPSNAPKTVAGPSHAPKTVAPPPSPSAAKTTSTLETSSQLVPTDAEGKQIEAAPSTSNENANPPPKETVMEETLRRTRRRLRKARSAPVRKDTDSAASGV